MRKAALITGGSRGIGKSFARALLRAEFDVCITAMRDETVLMHSAAELATEFGAERVMAVQSDAGQPEAAESAVRAVVSRFGRIDVLVNNAGRGPLEYNPAFHLSPKPFWEIEPEAWAGIVTTNVNGPFYHARAAAPLMVEQGWGRIIGISTSLVTMIKQGFAPYGPSKAALDVMTRGFADDLAGTGVTVNILAPGGPTETDFIPAEGRTGLYTQLLPVNVMDAALVWLCSPAADAVSGGRFIGKLWDEAHPEAAREDTGEAPRTL